MASANQEDQTKPEGKNNLILIALIVGGAGLLILAVLAFLQIQEKRPDPDTVIKEKGLLLCRSLELPAVMYLGFSKIGQGISQDVLQEISQAFDRVLELEGVVNAALCVKVGSMVQFLPGLGRPISISPESDPEPLELHGVVYENTEFQKGRAKTGTGENVIWFTHTFAHKGQVGVVYVILLTDPENQGGW